MGNASKYAPGSLIELVLDTRDQMARIRVRDHGPGIRFAPDGDVTRGPRIITDKTRKEMRKILDEIQSGRFAREFILENQANRPVMNALLKRDSDHTIEVVGEKLRKMMPFVGKKLQ